MSEREPDLLRFTTAGSVDDGKSTLIGRLLYDSKSIFEDQLEQVEDTSRRRGEDGIDLSLLTDGLRAEREQKITIDVAYRYFATPRRKFIIADTPGHVQYTRNMVTGASTADLAIILVDARNGILTQSRRHAFIASLLRIPHAVVAINKMDLVDWSPDVFREIVGEFTDFAEKLGLTDLTFIPMSALLGDNVVDPSENMPWYRGSTLLRHLETVPVLGRMNLRDLRLPVQYVVRPDQDFRGYAGRIASGVVRAGDAVTILPSGRRTAVESVYRDCAEVEEGRAGESILVTTVDEIDISRGDMIVRDGNQPVLGRDLDATICWMTDEPLQEGQDVWLRHTTRSVRARVTRIVHRIDVDTLHREARDTLELNDIARVEIAVASPIAFDPYALNRATGSFILVDPATKGTVAAGMIRAEVRQTEDPADRVRPESQVSPNVVWEEGGVELAEREARNGHRSAVVWFTGLSGSGKTTVARAVESELFRRGVQVARLDGDLVRHGLNGDLGFSLDDRTENIRRIAEVAALMARQGQVVLCSFVSPYTEGRAFARSRVEGGRFYEVWVNTPLEECERRDSKGLYARARSGEIANFTGISDPYEEPVGAELEIDTSQLDVPAAADHVIAMLAQGGVLRRPDGSLP